MLYVLLDLAKLVAWLLNAWEGSAFAAG